MTENLKEITKAAVDKSYSPYSGFKVAASVEGSDGKIYTSVNIENASFGLTSCAERNAIFQAVSDGCRTIKTVVIYTPTQKPTPPCGACRQVIREFSDSARVLSVCDSDEIIDSSIDQLLPASFDLDD